MKSTDEARLMHDEMLTALRVDLSRRRLLATGIGGAALLVFGAMLPTGCARYAPPTRRMQFLSRKEYAIVNQAAVRILGLPSEEGPRIGVFIDDLLANLPPTTQGQARLMLRVVEHGTHLFDLKAKRFTRLSPAAQDIYLEGWMRSSLGARRIVFRALKALAALGYYAQQGSWEGIGYEGPWLGRVSVEERPQGEEPVSLAELLARERSS